MSSKRPRGPILDDFVKQAKNGTPSKEATALTDINGVLPNLSADHVRISPSFERLEDLSVDKLYDFLLGQDQNLKPLAVKFKNDRVSGIDLMNFGDDDYQNFSVTYKQKNQLKLLIKQKQLGSTSNLTVSTRNELDLSLMQNELNHSNDTVQNQKEQIQQKNIIIKRYEDTVEKLNQEIEGQNSTIKQLQTTIQKQSLQILALMDLTNQQLSQTNTSSSGPPPKNSFTEQSSTVKDQLTNISADIQLIPILSPGSSAQVVPIIQPEAPTAIRLNKSKPHVPARMTSLPTSSEGPNSSVVKFPTVYHPQREILVIKPVMEDPYNISNYGTYRVKIFSEDSQHILVETLVNLVPQIEVCVPKQFEVRDSIHNLIVGGIVTLKRVGESVVAFAGETDQTGTVTLPDNLADGSYEVEIYSPNNSKLQRLKFFMVIFQNRRQGTAKPFIGRGDLNPNEIEIVLRWAAVPRDLDSHLYSSDGRHIHYRNKIDGNMSLDWDVTTGNGPETVKFTIQPNLKYIYAVHCYSSEPML
ncbi:unnamed protein product, partial [Didymodactylos carnosus]